VSLVGHHPFLVECSHGGTSAPMMMLSRVSSTSTSGSTGDAFVWAFFGTYIGAFGGAISVKLVILDNFFGSVSPSWLCSCSLVLSYLHATHSNNN
jgi:hypothetical protein